MKHMAKYGRNHRRSQRQRRYRAAEQTKHVEKIHTMPAKTIRTRSQTSTT